MEGALQGSRIYWRLLLVHTMSEQLLVDLYYQVLKLRLVEEEIAKRYSYGEMRCPVHLSLGQEAVSAAFALIVNKRDYAVSTHRGHTHYLAKGGNLNRMIAEIYGKEAGCAKGRGGSMHLVDIDVNFMGTSAIVGNSIPVGVGLAYDQMLNGYENFSYIFLGDGAVEEGVFAESASFASLHNLPVIFVCENNGYSVYTQLSARQPSLNYISNLATALGLNYFKGDGKDAKRAFNTFKQAIGSFYTNKQPIFIEFITSREREHCGPNNDDHLEYRNLRELAEIAERDPLKVMERILTEELSFDATSLFSSFRREIMIEIEDAFVFAEKSPFPKPHWQVSK